MNERLNARRLNTEQLALFALPRSGTTPVAAHHPLRRYSRRARMARGRGPESGRSGYAKAAAGHESVVVGVRYPWSSRINRAVIAMSNLSRYDPFSLEPVSDLFQGFFRPMRALTVGGEQPLADIKLDISEGDTAYTVKAELPGVDKKDIDVKIDGNVVSISATAERRTACCR